jgi:CelD/BcsL family acetyltransferase involved in cellulose biosynthesis
MSLPGPGVSRGPVRTRRLSGFDDASLGRARWNALALANPTPSPYLTWELQRAFEEIVGWGELVLVAAERGGGLVALAALRYAGGQLCFNGTTFEFDRLDFLGDVSDPEVLAALLAAARDHTSESATFDFEFVHDDSPTHRNLPGVASALGLAGGPKYESVGLELDLAAQPERVHSSTSKQVLKDERWLVKNGRLEVHHLRDPAEILPRLPALFDQHRRRWPGPENPSRFHDPEICRLFEVATERWVGADILRFTQIDWDGRPIACHYGLELAGRRFMKAFSFEPELRGRSPGGILMRHIILGALEEGVQVFDFGTGDQDFKARYATRSWRVLGWKFYPPDDE